MLDQLRHSAQHSQEFTLDLPEYEHEAAQALDRVAVRCSDDFGRILWVVKDAEQDWAVSMPRNPIISIHDYARPRIA